MTTYSQLEDLPDIVASILTDGDGKTVRATGAVPDPGLVAVQIAAMVRDMDQLAATLRLGFGEVFTIQGEQTRRVIGMQRGAIAVIEIGPKRQIADVELTLRGCDWASAIVPPSPLAVWPHASNTDFDPGAPDAPATAGAGLVLAPDPGPPERSPVFAGDLQLFSVPDVLEFLRTGQRTGKLSFRSTAGLGIVQLRRGRITSAVSPAAAGIGHYLVKTGELSALRLGELVDASGGAAPADAVVARLLLERGLASDEDLRTALLARMHDAVRELITWLDGRFAFDPSAPIEPLLPGLDVEVDSQPLLLNILREQDEAGRPS